MAHPPDMEDWQLHIHQISSGGQPPKHGSPVPELDSELTIPHHKNLRLKTEQRGWILGQIL
jgi:hypothetical protein